MGQRRPSSTSTPRRFDYAKTALLVGSAIGFFFLAFPQVALLWQGIQSHGWEGLSQSGILEAMFLSLLTTGFSTLLTLTIGTPLAYVLARWRFRGRRLIIVIVELPIVLPPTVAGIALLVAAGRRGLLGPLLTVLGINLPFTTAAVVIAQTFISAPFYILAAQVGFSAVPTEIEDAARVDGAAGWQLFWTVTLPLSRTALAAGLTLSWARALGEFGATILFAGSIAGRTETMTLFVYNVLESNLNAAIWASLILMGFAFIALIISQWLSRHTETIDQLSDAFSSWIRRV